MAVTDCADAHSAPATVVADLGRSAFFAMALSILDFSSFQLDAVHAVRRAMRLGFADAFSSRSRLFSLVCNGFLAFFDFGVVAGEPSLARPHLGFGLRSCSTPNQAPQHNAYARPFSAFLGSPVRRG